MFVVEAEILIQLGDVTGGIGYINQIRNRAKNSKKIQKILPLTGDAANYNIQPYPLPFSGGTAEAMNALKLERRLELSLEDTAFSISSGGATQPHTLMHIFLQRRQSGRI